MDLRSTQLKDTYGNLLTIGTSAGSPTTGTIENGDGQDITILTVAGKLVSTALQPSFDTNFYNVDGTISSYSASNYMYVNGLGGASGQGLRLNSNGSAINFIALENSNDSITLNTNSNERLRIDSSGNTSIYSGVLNLGTDSVASSLNCIGDVFNIGVDSDGNTGGSPSIRFNVSGSEKARIDSSGNVGIATTSPTSLGGGAKLTVNQATDGNIVFARGGSTRQVQLGTTSTTGYINADNTSGGFTFNVNALEKARIDSSGNLQARRTRSNTVGDVALSLQPTDSTIHYGFRIDSANNFLNIDRVDSPLNLISITGAGNVGIGTASAEKRLHINDNTQANQAIRFGNPNATPYGEINYDSSGSEHLYIRAKGTISGYGNIVFESGGSLNEAMRIDSSGAVGINNSSPNSFATSVSTSSSLVIGQGASGVSPGLTLWQGNSAQATINFASANTGAGQYEGRIRYTRDTGVMDFRTNGLDNVLVLNASGNVGIGTSPDTNLHIYDASGGATLKIASNTANAYDSSKIQMIGGNLSTSELIFGDTADSDTGRIIYRHDGNSLAFDVNAGEKMRIDSSGNVLVGHTSAEGDSSGTTLYQNGQTVHKADGAYALELVRSTSDGEIARFRKDGTTVGSIGTKLQSSVQYYYIAGSSTGIGFYSSGIYPSTSDGTFSDNTKDLGSSSVRWDDVYATNGTINTSDRNEKQDIEELNEAELRVAQQAKTLLRKFRWKSSVAENENARIHFGIIAQDLEQAFTDEGLDAGRYGMFIKSTWTNEDGEEQTRLGVRYNQLLAFIISAI